MEAHYQLSDLEFERQFASCELNPSIFNHEAHLRLSWIYINSYGLDEAEKRIQQQLQNYVAALGAKDKYNTTLTIAAVRLVDHFMKKSDIKNFRDFITVFPQLKDDFKSLITSHYSFDIFNSEEAKATFLEPDLEPFIVGDDTI
ncbi:MAG: hypothetical protein MI974_25645 [Chitinophagales bacterium]|nr:hypothetical protein [Chitinophagales bacterium]